MGLLLLFYGILFIQYDYRAPKRHFSDFHMMYTAGARFLNGEPIYTFEGDVSYFKYPPFFAFFMGPIASLPERQAARLWCFLNLLFLSVLSVTLRILLPPLASEKVPWLYALAGVASFRILLENLHGGQANLFMLTLLWSAILCFSKGRDLLGGFFFAFSMLTKYLTVLFVPVFLLERRFRFLGWTILFLLILTLLPSFSVGLRENANLLIEGTSFLFKSSLDDISITTPPNQSLLALLGRLFYGESPVGFHLLDLSRKELFLLYGGVCLFLYMVCLSALPGRETEPFSPGRLSTYACLSLCMSLFNPNAWRNAFLPISVSYLVLFHYLLKEKGKDSVILGLVTASFFLISLSSEFFVQEKGVKLTDLYSAVTGGTLCLFAALLKLRFFPKQKQTEGVS